MGFFSRLFPPRADGKPISDEWTVLPEDNASELVLFGDDAATLMLQLDIDDAIASHQAWSQRLQDVLEGTPDAAMQPAMAHDDTCCHLGQWLHGAGRAHVAAPGPRRARPGRADRLGIAGPAGRLSVGRRHALRTRTARASAAW